MSAGDSTLCPALVGAELRLLSKEMSTVTAPVLEARGLRGVATSCIVGQQHTDPQGREALSPPLPQASRGAFPAPGLQGPAHHAAFEPD